MENINALSAGANAIYNSVSNYWSDNGSNHSILMKKNILRIGNILYNIFSNTNNTIDIPKIVVVGSQSSGKSSLLNGILSFELLPTGKDMVTRTPLHLELIPSEENVAEFGNYNNNEKWVVKKKLSFSLPKPTIKEKKNILKEIEIETISLAGDRSNISDKPIYLKIYSKNIPNLTLIDLPGLTMVACTDKGQPVDIKVKIENLISKYISSKKTIILAVIPARTDIETDIALGLVKKHDPNGERTIGILTKVDLMNDNTDVKKYLLNDNNVSKDLRLKYGYYAVRNKTPNEKKISILEGFKKEQEYFNKHPIYSRLSNKSNLGIPNMTNTISNILVHEIKNSIPFVLEEINIRLNKVNNDLLDLGSSIPSTEEERFTTINNLITNFSRDFVYTLECRGAILNTGRNC